MNPPQQGIKTAERFCHEQCGDEWVVYRQPGLTLFTTTPSREDALYITTALNSYAELKGLLDEKINEIAGSQPFVRRFQEIEQENQRLKAQVTATQDLYKEACRHVLEFRQENQRLREALGELFRMVELGVLVRDTSHDADAKWYLKAMELAQVLKKAQQALATDTKGG